MKRKYNYWIILPVLILVTGITSMAQDATTDSARITALQSRLTELERQIGLLEDSKAIKRLQRAYGYYFDKGVSHEVAGLFSNQATVELAGYGVYVGKEHIAAFYQRLLGDGNPEGQLNNHIITQGVVHVAPDGLSAKGRWRAVIQAGQHDVSAQWAEGPYENEYIKENGVWKFSKVHWYMTFSAPYDPGWHQVPQPMAEPLADLPPDLPPTVDYQSYPAAFLPPYHYANPVTGRPSGVIP